MAINKNIKKLTATLVLTAAFSISMPTTIGVDYADAAQANIPVSAPEGTVNETFDCYSTAQHSYSDMTEDLIFDVDRDSENIFEEIVSKNKETATVDSGLVCLSSFSSLAEIAKTE